MSAQSLKDQYTEAFDTLARAGIAAYRTQYGGMPVLSHICFKFSNPNLYHEYVDEAGTLGAVTKTQHNGVEITWCRLAAPLQAGSIKLEWLEFVHPAKDPSPISGVSSIGYCVKDLANVVKIDSADPDVIFRYQALSAAEMAGP